jgi:hypothetical protein
MGQRRADALSRWESARGFVDRLREHENGSRDAGDAHAPATPTVDGMIRLLRDMPVGVVGLKAVDDVEQADYENVLLPAVNAALAEHGKVRLVYVLGPEFDEYEGDAV